MKTKNIAKVISPGFLEIPPEILSQLQVGDQYKVIIKENIILLEKITQTPTTTVDLDKFIQELQELQPDPNQPTLQEISEIVKEVRQELWAK